MVNVSVARRYARALLELAQESSRLDVVGQELHQLAEVVGKNAELTQVLNDPSYTREVRLSVILQVLQTAHLRDPIILNLVHLLIERHRMVYLADIDRAYQMLADTKAGRLRGEVTSAVALEPATVKELEQTLEQITQRDVILEQRVDPSVLGGVLTQVGSVTYDGTLRTQLDAMRRNLAQN